MYFITNLPTAKQVVPAVATFHNPSSCSVSRISFPLLLFVAARFDVCDVAASRRRPTQLWVVVAFVAAQMLARFFLRRGSRKDHGVQRRGELLHVVPVGASKRDGQRNAVGIRERVPFGAQFAAIRRISSGLVPPGTGADTVALSIDWKRQSIPWRSS